jgi:hypothetical protein
VGSSEDGLEKRFNELNNLFDNGPTMNALPTGYSAGAGIGLLAGENKLIAEWLDSFAEKNWRGKIYFSSNDKIVSEGRNRFRKSFLHRNSPFVPMLKFKTMLLASHPLAPRANRISWF